MDFLLVLMIFNFLSSGKTEQLIQGGPRGRVGKVAGFQRS